MMDKDTEIFQFNEYIYALEEQIKMLEKMLITMKGLRERNDDRRTTKDD